ncbi:hypothetical protein ACOM2C_10505 [Pseudarthrobacter sp. So.54]
MLPGADGRFLEETGRTEAAQVRGEYEGVLVREDRGDVVEGPHVVREPVQEDDRGSARIACRFVADIQDGGLDAAEGGKAHAAILTLPVR